MPLLELQLILVLLGQQFRMPMRERRFLIYYKEMLAIETTITSANSWNSCFHQNSGDSGSPCFARTAVHLNLLGQRSRVLMSEQQFLIFDNEMLTIETAVSSANLWNSCFHKPWGGGSSSSCFARTMFLLKFCWDNEGKTRTAASLQTNGTRQGLKSFTICWDSGLVC